MNWSRKFSNCVKANFTGIRLSPVFFPLPNYLGKSTQRDGVGNGKTSILEEVIFILLSKYLGYVVKASTEYMDSESVIWLYSELLLVILFTCLF